MILYGYVSASVREISGEARKKFMQGPTIKKIFFKTNILNLRIKYIFSPINYNFLGLVLKKIIQFLSQIFKILQKKKWV